MILFCWTFIRNYQSFLVAKVVPDYRYLLKICVEIKLDSEIKDERLLMLFNYFARLVLVAVRKIDTS